MNPKVLKFLTRHFFFEIVAVAGIISFHQMKKKNVPLTKPAHPENKHDLIGKTRHAGYFEPQLQSPHFMRNAWLPEAKE